MKQLLKTIALFSLMILVGTTAWAQQNEPAKPHVDDYKIGSGDVLIISVWKMMTSPERLSYCQTGRYQYP